MVPGTLLNEIFIVDSEDNVDHFFNVEKDGNVQATTVKREYGAMPDAKPTMILDEQTTRDLIAAFSDLAREKGLNGPSAAEGKLSATERHLDDMRKLVFFNIEKENV